LRIQDELAVCIQTRGGPPEGPEICSDIIRCFCI